MRGHSSRLAVVATGAAEPAGVRPLKESGRVLTVLSQSLCFSSLVFKLSQQGCSCSTVKELRLTHSPAGPEGSRCANVGFLRSPA